MRSCHQVPYNPFLPLHFAFPSRPHYAWGPELGLRGEVARPPGEGQLCLSPGLGTSPLTRREGSRGSTHLPCSTRPPLAYSVPRSSFSNQGVRPDDTTNQTSSHSQLFLNSFKICSKNPHNNMSGTIRFQLGQLGSSFSSTRLMFYKSNLVFLL